MVAPEIPRATGRTVADVRRPGDPPPADHRAEECAERLRARFAERAPNAGRRRCGPCRHLVPHRHFLEQHHERRRDQRRPDPDHERVRGRDRERLVDRIDDRRDERLDLGAERLRNLGEDRRTEVADAAERCRAERRRRPGRRLSSGGTSAAASWRGASSTSVVPKIVPVMARPTVPPTCWKNVRLLVAVPSRSIGTRSGRSSVKTANVGPTPRPVDEHPQPQRAGSACRRAGWSAGTGRRPSSPAPRPAAVDSDRSGPRSGPTAVALTIRPPSSGRIW